MRMDLLARFEPEFPDVLADKLTADRELIGKEWFTYLMPSPRIPLLIRIWENFQISFVSGKSRQMAKVYFQYLAMGSSRLLSKPRCLCGRRLWMYGTRLRDN